MYYNFSERMAKTHAQRQKEYRERKKAELGDTWVKAENRRTQKYYVPTAFLSKDRADQRRKRVKKNVRQFRKKLSIKKESAQFSSNVVSSYDDIPSACSNDAQTPQK